MTPLFFDPPPPASCLTTSLMMEPMFLQVSGCHLTNLPREFNCDVTHYSGQTYAEIEVMKMVMVLTAPGSGTVHYVKRAGAVLEAGSIVARYVLD